MRFQFRHLRTRILFFVVGLLSLILGTFYFAANTANMRNARAHIDEALELTVGALHRSLHGRKQNLYQNVRLLSGDFAFKSAFATEDHETILSALNNHRLRVGADVMMLISLDDEVLADTLHPELDGEDFVFPHLVEQAMDSEFGEGSMIERIDGEPYQLVMVPLFAPDMAAWIVSGFLLEQGFVDALQQSTRSDVTMLYRTGDSAWSALASTLPADVSRLTTAEINRGQWKENASAEIGIGRERSIYVVAPLPETGNTPLVAVLQRSLLDAMRPFLELRPVLLGIVLAGLVLSIFGAWRIACSVTRPVDVLIAGAQRVEQGEFTEPVIIAQRDELGRLAGSFNNMMSGLEERERVHNLLGKVVSPQIAEELLSKKIELGGEEREVTILFSDVRGFTNLCEAREAHEVLALLNRYLTRMTVAIEQHGGVVDKYIGDAIMALFGAPLNLPCSSEAAVLAGMGMCEAVTALNKELLAEGSTAIDIGIGINTAVVVAGNMGSETRMNYTVVGDGVNTAARLEGLSKHYGCRMIVSESTKTECPDIVFRELDRVRVKGKTRPVTLFEPLAVSHDELSMQHSVLAAWHAGLHAFYSAKWDIAEKYFHDCASEARLQHGSELFLQRIAGYRLQAPVPDWDGVHTFTSK